MRIFYTASFYGKGKYQKDYDLVLNSLNSTNSEIISPEKGNYLEILNKEELTKLKDKAKIHYSAIRKGIQWSQGVVIEMSQEDFQLGHEATLAIQTRKHVLCLSVHEDFSKKIISPYFHGAKYNQYNIEEIIEEFLETVKDEALNERFNLFLNSKQISHIKTSSNKIGVNKSEYLRMLIDNDRG